MKRSAFAGPYVLWMALFTVAPLIFIVYFAFRGDGGFTFANVRKFMDPIYLSVLWRSLYLAVYCTVICLIVGIPRPTFWPARIFPRIRRFSC